MEFASFVQLLGSVVIVYCGAIFVLSAGLFFRDREPVQKQSAKPIGSDGFVEEERDPRAA